MILFDENVILKSVHVAEAYMYQFEVPLDDH